MTFYPKRKVFISYYHGDQTAVNKFVQDFRMYLLQRLLE